MNQDAGRGLLESRLDRSEPLGRCADHRCHEQQRAAEFELDDFRESVAEREIVSITGDRDDRRDFAQLTKYTLSTDSAGMQDAFDA